VVVKNNKCPNQTEDSNCEGGSAFNEPRKRRKEEEKKKKKKKKRKEDQHQHIHHISIFIYINIIYQFIVRRLLYLSLSLSFHHQAKVGG